MNTEQYMNKIADTDLIDISTIIDDMWKGLMRYWWLLLALISLISSLTYFNARRIYRPVYQASSTFTVEARTASLAGYESYNNTITGQMGAIFPYVLTSEIMQKLIAEDLGRDSVPGTISASAMDNSNIITLSAKASSGQLAYDILQSAIKNYPSITEYVIGTIELHPIDETGVPELPVNMPEFKRTAFKGFIRGLGLSIIILLIYALTRKTIRKEDDIKRIMNVTWLGAIPRVAVKKRSSGVNTLLLNQKGVPNGFIEAVRTMRTRIEKGMQQYGINSFLVTSAIQGEGKTSMAVNIAISLVYKGNTVILIDGDLRHPSLAGNLNIQSNGVGFIDLLTGHASFNEVSVNYSKNHNLTIIPGGEPASNTSAILNSASTAEIFSELKKMADYVILDTPPSAIMSDAATYAQYVEGAVYIVRQDYAKPERIREGLEMFADTNIHILGCALNDASEGITGYGYGYGYGYGRYGGYGYYRRNAVYGSGAANTDALEKNDSYNGDSKSTGKKAASAFGKASKKKGVLSGKTRSSSKKNTSDQQRHQGAWQESDPYYEASPVPSEDDYEYGYEDGYGYEDDGYGYGEYDSYGDIEYVDVYQ